MKKSKMTAAVFKAAAALAFAAALAAAPASALTVDLTADTGVVTMPDGTAVTVWGFYLTGSQTTVQFPGPRIAAVEGDSLTINLTNNLEIPVSLVIPGQSAPLTPVWVDAAAPYGAPVATGSRPGGDVTSRVRSFTHETPAASGGTPGGPVAYTWPSLATGTYLYQSGTHPALQVQMGLYGALTVTTAAGDAYTGVSFDDETLLLFHEIDSAVHAAADHTDTASFPATNVYSPDYFLINGLPFSPGDSPLFSGLPGRTLLLRLLNAGLQSHDPLLQGASASLVAGDGRLFPHPRETYSFTLHAGKTLDAVVPSTPAGYLPLYDRRFYLANGSSGDPGGMMGYLHFSAAAPATLTVAATGGGSGRIVSASLPGGIDCGADCSEGYDPGTEVRLSPIPDPGSLLAAWSDPACAAPGDCVVAVAGDMTVTGTFRTYGKVRLVSPNGGAKYDAGDKVDVWWGAPPAADTATVQLSVNNGRRWKTLARRVRGSHYVLTVPALRKARRKSLVRVKVYNGAGKLIGSDRSNRTFTIRRAGP